MGTALLEVDGEHVGEVFSIPESKLKGKQWIGVQFARADVVRSALRLIDDGEVWVPGESGVGSIPMCRLGEIGEIGPDRRRPDGMGSSETDSCNSVPDDGRVTIPTNATIVSVCQPDHYLVLASGEHLDRVAIKNRGTANIFGSNQDVLLIAERSETRHGTGPSNCCYADS